MSGTSALLEVLEAQYRDYCSMYEVGQEQRQCIERGDFAGLERAFAHMHELMHRVRRRQEQLPPAAAWPASARRHKERLCRLVERLQEQRQSTQRLAEQLLQRHRADYRHFGRGRQAARGYGRNQPQRARLYDGTR